MHDALPPHAHVPGVNTRHPDDRFDALKASVQGVPLEELHVTAAFEAGLAWLDAGYYWESHEVLEAVWLRTPDPSPEREMVQALIQLANARLKQRMGRPNAVRRLCGMVADHLAACPTDRVILGLRAKEVEDWLAETQNSKKEYYNALNWREAAR
ncbi:DUF309 domain-containing protein [Sulfitobacter sp. D35]|uniref:DUF309 domain-containing protein n=1 Tax=Sulfitobacter sp. D35 TaxID=3083252 RepID=UPI00296F9AB3|nr:DUF309 domain-containing protein [Sulfitobacter sp. D35]MDW4497279.1 DUF309 domain-containing protein [Sulfitobacter sp. D35]